MENLKTKLKETQNELNRKSNLAWKNSNIFEVFLSSKSTLREFVITVTIGKFESTYHDVVVISEYGELRYEVIRESGNNKLLESIMQAVMNTIEEYLNEKAD